MVVPSEAERKLNIPDGKEGEEIEPYATVRLSMIFPLSEENNGPSTDDIPLETLPFQTRTTQEERATGRTELQNSAYENTDHLGESSVTPVEYLFYEPRYENKNVDCETRTLVIRPGYDKLTPSTRRKSRETGCAHLIQRLPCGMLDTHSPFKYDSLIRETDLRCQSRRVDITDREGVGNMNIHTKLEVPSRDERSLACPMERRNQEISLSEIESECIENVWKQKDEEVEAYATVRLSMIFPLSEENNGPNNDDIPLETLPFQTTTPQEERATGRTELQNSAYENTDHLGESSVTPVEYLFYEPRYENKNVDCETRTLVIRPGYDKLTSSTRRKSRETGGAHPIQRLPCGMLDTHSPSKYDSLIRETDLRCKSRRVDITDREGEGNMNIHTKLEVPSRDERSLACSMEKRNQEISMSEMESECIGNAWKQETLI